MTTKQQEVGEKQRGSKGKQAGKKVELSSIEPVIVTSDSNEMYKARPSIKQATTLEVRDLSNAANRRHTMANGLNEESEDEQNDLIKLPSGNK